MQDVSSLRPAHGGNLTWAATLAGCSPSLLLDFSASINPLGPPQSAIDSIQASLGGLRHYPDPDYRELRQAISQFHQLPPEWILPGNGSAELLTWVSRELAELDAVYLITPAFGDYLRALRAFSTPVIPCPFPLEGRDWDAKGGTRSPALAALPIAPLPPPSTGLLLNNPHNPTGQLFERDRILPYLKQFSLVVIDEAFMDFLRPEQQHSLVDCVSEYPNLVILRSLTKFYSLPGLRLGYAIAHPERLQRWQTWRDPWSVNTLAAAAGVSILQDHVFQQRTWDWLAPARTALLEGLAQLPGLAPLPGAANFLLVKVDTAVVGSGVGSVLGLQRQLLQRYQILIRDCVSFPELGDRFFRVAVRTEAENQRLLTALAEILHIH